MFMTVGGMLLLRLMLLVKSYYGAPFLSEEGWYWYCVGLGGGFNKDRWLNSWRPNKIPENGHNLATLFVTVRHAINEEGNRQ
jgi:hypothetical protein